MAGREPSAALLHAARGRGQGDDRQVRSPGVECHFHFHSRARLPADQRPRPGARRAPRPARLHLYSRFLFLKPVRYATHTRRTDRQGHRPGLQVVLGTLCRIARQTLIKRLTDLALQLGPLLHQIAMVPDLRRSL